MICENKWRDSLSNVKWILTILIVLYHIQVYGEGALFIKNLGDGVVDAFSLISGFLYFRTVVNWKDIEKKIIRRIYLLIIPYFLWNFIHTIILNAVQCFQTQENNSFFSISVLQDLVKWNSSPHFWYIFMLIFWSVLSPILFFVYRNRVLTIFLLLLQLLYIAYMGENMLHSRFIYIIFTWGGYIGYKDPNLLYKIEKIDFFVKRYLLLFSGTVYLMIYFLYSSINFDMNILIWLYGIRGVALISLIFNMPVFIFGKIINYRYSFWLFAVHYWLDIYFKRIMELFFSNIYIVQIFTFISVLIVGIGTGVLIDKVCPNLFSLLTGNRSCKKRELLEK